MKLVNIELNQIDENSVNSEIFSMDNIEHLAKIIKEEGFNTPITVYKKSDGRYEILSGHRRYKAMKYLDAKTIPACVLKEPDDILKKKILISSNMASRRLSPYEIANQIKYYKSILKEAKVKGNIRKEIAEYFNISEANVYRYECLLNLIPEFQELTKKPNFPYSSLRSVASLSEEQQREVYNSVKILEANQKKIDNVDEDIKNVDVEDNVYTRVVIEQIVNNIKQREKPFETKNVLSSKNVHGEQNNEKVVESNYPTKYQDDNRNNQDIIIKPLDDFKILYNSSITRKFNHFEDYLRNISIEEYTNNDKKELKECVNSLKKLLKSIEEKYKI